VASCILHYSNNPDPIRTQCGIEVSPKNPKPKRQKPLVTAKLSEVDCKRCLWSYGSAERGANGRYY
jgi:hypothetical protein